MRSRQPKYLPSWLMSKWLIVVVLVTIFFLGSILIKEFYRSYQINKEIALLHQEISSLQTQNEDISEFVEYLKTDRYFQEQARLKFGLKDAGEKVIIVKDGGKAIAYNGAQDSQQEDIFNFSGTNTKQKTNPSKWFAYFLSKK